jgi:hypothetical protein
MRVNTNIKTRGFPSPDFSDFGFFLDGKNNNQINYVCKNHTNSVGFEVR